MRVLLLVPLMLAIFSCTPQETKLLVGDGAGAFMEGSDILLFGADHEGTGTDGGSFPCPDEMTQCRRLFLARYDKNFKQTALYTADHAGQELIPALYPRAAGGYYLIAATGNWSTSGEGTSTPEFDVVVTRLSAALEATDEFVIPSEAPVKIHAAFLSGTTLAVAGMGDDGLFLDRYDAETGEKKAEAVYSDEKEGRVVFLGGKDEELHIMRWLPSTGFRYLVVGADDAVVNFLTLNGDSIDPDPTVGARGIAAGLSGGTLHWLGEDNGFYRFVRDSTVTIETAAMLDAGDLTYQRDFRFIGSNLYVLGANDRVQRFEACAYGGDDTTIKTHETELVLVKFDASYVQLWSDRDTEDATYRAIEVLTRGKERFFLFQKGATIYLRPTE